VRGGCTLSRVDSEEAIALISGLIDSLRVELAQYGYPIVGAKLQYAIDFQMEHKPLPQRLEPILVRFCHELCQVLRQVHSTEGRSAVEQHLQAELKTI
jgi:hypothetical protein